MELSVAIFLKKIVIGYIWIENTDFLNLQSLIMAPPAAQARSLQVHFKLEGINSNITSFE